MLFKIRSKRAFSTFNILPLNGKIACVFESRPSFVDPPAESPSTKKISLSSGFLLEQSASLPGKLEISNADLRRVTSRAFLAATRALDAIIPFSTMILAIFGFSYKKRSKCSENNRSTI